MTNIDWMLIIAGLVCLCFVGIAVLSMIGRRKL